DTSGLRLQAGSSSDVQGPVCNQYFSFKFEDEWLHSMILSYLRKNLCDLLVPSNINTI
ncbi:hypothetical protein ATANTOWER_003001, partial [Ataeniobius toweri]|nr:hypothetical protein [Ataeniobius toweri]